MQSRHAFLYYLTVLLIETALFLLAFVVHTLVFDPRPLAPQGVDVAFLKWLKSAVGLTLLRIICCQIPVNILFHLLALGRARGYARVLGSSIAVNAGTLLLLLLIMGMVYRSNGSFFDTGFDAEIAMVWVVALLPSVLAPILALRFWRRALASENHSPPLPPARPA